MNRQNLVLKLFRLFKFSNSLNSTIIPQNRSLFTVSLLIITLLSFWIRTKDLLFGGTLWWDEAMLADNIVSRGYFDLCKPLDWFQVAPIGYLFLVKFISSLTGYSDWGFRLLSFIVGSSIPPLFFLLAFRLSKNFIISFTISLSVCFNPYLILYSTELKPYILDVLLGLIFFYILAFKSANFTNKKISFYIALFLCFGGLFFSYYYIIAATLFVYMLTYTIPLNRKILLYMAFTIFAASTSYFIFAYRHPYTDFMHTFWQNADGFIDTSTGYLSVLKVIYWKILNTLSHYFSSQYNEVLLLCISIFAIFIGYRRPRMFLWLVLPIIIHISLSIIGKFPLSPRLQLLWILNIFIIFVVFSQLQKSRIVKYSMVLIVFMLTMPWNSLLDILHKPIIKCDFTNFLNYIPASGTVYLSESLVPLYNVEMQRNSATYLKGVHYYLGKCPINSESLTSQTFGIVKKKELNNINYEIDNIRTTPLYVLMHYYTKADITDVIEYFKPTRRIDILNFQPAVSPGCKLFTNSTSMVLLKLDNDLTHLQPKHP